MDKSEPVRRALAYIEAHLDEDTALTAAAQAGSLSLMQLYRDFYTYTGHAVKQYIRLRRLSNACSLLKVTDMPLAEVALACGYTSQQGLNKHIREVLKLTPLAYKAGENFFHFAPANLLDCGLTVQVSTQTIPAGTVLCYESSRLVGIEGEALCALGDLVGERGLKGLKLFGHNDGQQGNRFVYQLRIADNQSNWLVDKGNFTSVTQQPAITGLYATCILPLNEKVVITAWNLLYDVWLTNSMFESAGKDYLEEYLMLGNKHRRVKLYLPIRKRQDAAVMTITQQDNTRYLTGCGKEPGGEAKAARRVITHLKHNHPQLLRETTHFYVCYREMVWDCGIAVPENFYFEAAEGIRLCHHPAGLYGILTGDSCSEYESLARRLLHAIKEIGLYTCAGVPFAVYETPDGLMVDRVIMRVMVLLEPVKNRKYPPYNT